MARSKEEKERNGDVKKHKEKKKSKKGEEETAPVTETATFSLLADEARIDPTLSSLFAVKSAPVVSRKGERIDIPAASQVDLDENYNDAGSVPASIAGQIADPSDKDAQEAEGGKRKRKRNQGNGEELEDAYMRRLIREEEKETEAAAAERAAKRQKSREDEEDSGDDGDEQDATPDADSEADAADELDETSGLSPPPRHETEQSADRELDKAKRTVFLGNVSTSAISSKASRKVLIDHLKSIFASAPARKDGDTKDAVESIRFRSTPYASAMPKKAAFARKEIMDATTKSTHAYAVYSSAFLAREAVRQLNGSIVLDRHLRVDSVSHPAAVDNRRCVFVGNLGFVDDESNSQATNGEEGAKKPKPKPSSDIEEGLWREFGKCGKVQSVRVVRDSATRVGKGFAYVQFEDGNGVEAALALNEKKFPPMLPRKLRVTRAKAVSRNTKTGADQSKPNGYPSRASAQRASRGAQASKLFGKAVAAEARKPSQMDRSARRGPERSGENTVELPNGIKKPETIIFEGHRARSKGGKSGLKLGRKKGVKPTNRGAKRGAAFKASKKKAQK